MPRTAPSKKTRTRTGCRTCKIRKVKCDEEFPSCRKCVSTGRSCDGYGIRGGGGTVRGTQQAQGVSNGAVIDAVSLRHTIPVFNGRPQHAFPLFNASTEDQAMLDWFKCRTAVKLRGSFFSDFWTSLLFQSSVAEPAILHAVLALSAVHRNGIACQQGLPEAKSAVSRGLSASALRHYVQSIHHLQPHFSARGRLAYRVALITCIIFTSLDFLRGHFHTAFMHLDNGLKLITSEQQHFNTQRKLNHSQTTTQYARDYVDDWIEETFSRIHLQIGLIRFFHKATAFQPLPSRIGGAVIPRNGPFESIKQAWQGLEELIGRAIGLSGETWTHVITSQSPPSTPPSRLHKKQQILLDDADNWLASYQSCTATLLGGGSVPEQKANAILRAYHAMVAILASVSLSPGDEMIFDDNVDQFACLIGHMMHLREVSALSPLPSTPSGLSFDMARSIVDMGCIVPLYYTALKCRDHHIRTQAVEFLEGTYHREGAWDSTMTARIARKIMELEEGEERGSPCESGSSSSSVEPLRVPAARRLHDVEVTLVGEPVRKLSLLCRDWSCPAGISAKVCVGEFDLLAQTWTMTAQQHGTSGAL